MALEIVQVDFGSDGYRAVIELRRRILRQPLGLNFTAAEFATERDEIHLAVLEDSQLLGCLLLRPIDSQVLKLRQMAIAETARGRGLGTQLVRHAEQFAIAHGFTSMEMHARKSAQAFYEKLGYATQGDDFLEVTIPHVKMQKRLTV